MSVWKSDEKLLIFASLISPSKIILSYVVREVIASMSDSVSSSLRAVICSTHAWYIT